MTWMYTRSPTDQPLSREIGQLLGLYYYSAPIWSVNLYAPEEGVVLGRTVLDTDAMTVALSYLAEHTPTMTPYIKVMGLAQQVGNLVQRHIIRANPEDLSIVMNSHRNWLVGMFDAYEVRDSEREGVYDWIRQNAEYLFRLPAFRPAFDGVLSALVEARSMKLCDICRTIEQLVGRDLRAPLALAPEESIVRQSAYRIWRDRGYRLWHQDEDWYSALAGVLFGSALVLYR